MVVAPGILFSSGHLQVLFLDSVSSLVQVGAILSWANRYVLGAVISRGNGMEHKAACYDGVNVHFTF